MKYKTRDRKVAQLRELADFIEEYGVKLPGYVSVGTQATCYLTDTDYVRDPATNEYKSKLNETNTKENLRRFLAAVGSCEKEYTEDRIRVRKLYSFGGTMIEGTVDRSLACKRVVVGQKLEPAVFVQAKIVDEIEWQCDESLSLLKLVSD